MHYDQVASLLKKRRAGYTLPQDFYSSESVYDFDVEAIFNRTWIFVAFDVELPSAGSYVSMNIARTPIILLRTRDGEVKGYFNTCRHRGAQLLPEGEGRCHRIVCPYHQWSYSLDGSLLVARRMPSEFNKEEFGLRPIALESVGGTIYACLSDSPPDFTPFRDAFEPLITRYNLRDAKVVYHQRVVENANWKLAMENARECAHCQVGHPELFVSLLDVFPIDYDNPSDSRIADFLNNLRRRGIADRPQEGEWFSTGHIPLQPGMKSITMGGEYDVRKLLADDVGDLGYLRWGLQPDCYNIALPDYVFTFSVTPLSAQRTLVHSKWLVHKDAVEGVDYDLKKLRQLWETTNDQDISLTELNQRGVNSSGYRPGRYIPGGEDLCERFTDWYCDEAARYLELV